MKIFYIGKLDETKDEVYTTEKMLLLKSFLIKKK